MEKASTTLWWRHSRPSFYDPEYGSAVQRAEESYKRHSSAPRLRRARAMCPLADIAAGDVVALASRGCYDARVARAE